METTPAITIESRLRGALWGQLVGDAAALGTHWVYNLEDLKAAHPEGIHGFETPPKGHYHANKKPGAQTHYGDGALVALESLAATGRLDVTDFGRRWEEAFAPDRYTGYRDHATRGTFENLATFREKHPDATPAYQQGADDDQLISASAVAPVVVAHRDDPEVLDAVARFTRVRQHNDRAVAYLRAEARILLELLAGRDVHSALHRVEEWLAKEGDLGLEVRRKIGDAFARLGKTVTAATEELGQSCPLICSFPSSVHALLKAGDRFDEAIRNVLAAGGDNAGRAAIVGMWLGAHLGVDAIPEAWRNRLEARERIETAVETLVTGSAA